MSGPQIPFTPIPTNPTFSDAMNLLQKKIAFDLNCHHIGTIQSFNASLQTCTATINYPKTYFTLNAATGLYNATQVNYPILVDCPVIALGGGSAALTMPIQKGDECLVLFNDRDFGNWFAGGAGAAVATPRLHSFSDGIVLAGLRSKANVLSNYDSQRGVLRGGAAVVAVNTANNKVLLANVAPGLSGANLTYSTTLGTLLQALLTELQNLTTAVAAITVTGVTSGGGVSGVPSNASTISSIGTQIGNTATVLAGLLE